MIRISLALASALLLAACGSGGSTPSTGPTLTTPATPAPVAKDDACTLLAEADLQTVFTAAIPTPKGRNLGLGFADCLWEDDAALVRVSQVPLANLKSDYVDQLNVGGQVAELGAEAVWFPGVVGIGLASGGGVTVGAPVKDGGLLVAVKTGNRGEGAADRAKATELAKRISLRSGS
jgi:hypothetical protein